MRTVTTPSRRFGLILFLLLAAAFSYASEYPLHKVNGIEHFPEDPGLRAMLSKNGFAVVPMDSTLGGIYAQCDLPIFVTVDSALWAYQMLFEKAFQGLEYSQARRLQSISAKLLTQCWNFTVPDDPLWLDAHNRLIAWCAIGVKFQGEGFDLKELPQKAGQWAQSEWRKIKLGRADRSVIFPRERPFTYQFLKPAAFYSDSKVLGHYFSAAKWFGLAGFRINSEKERRAAYLLALVLAKAPNLCEEIKAFESIYDDCLGPKDDVDVLQSAACVVKSNKNPNGIFTASALEDFCRKINALPKPRINDQWLPLQTYETDFEGTTHGPRLLPPRYTWSDHLQTRISSRHAIRPTLLDITMALGDAQSENLLNSLPRKRDNGLVKSIGRDCLRLSPPSLYTDYNRILTRLYKPIPAGAPPFVRTPAWEAKTSWTGLAGWTRARYLWQLHAKDAGGSELGGPFDGYVSPYPEVFKGLSALFIKTKMLFQKKGIFKAIKHKAEKEKTDSLFRRYITASSFESFAEHMKDMAGIARKQLGNQPLTEKEQSDLSYYAIAMREHPALQNDRPRILLYNWVDPDGFGDTLLAQYAATGHAFEIYVIRKTPDTPEKQGHLQLYKGGILSLYDFTRPAAEERLNDKTWAALLHGPQKPPLPIWTSSFIPAVSPKTLDRFRAIGSFSLASLKDPEKIREKMLWVYRRIQWASPEKGNEYWAYCLGQMAPKDMAALLSFVQTLENMTHLQMAAKTFRRKASADLKEKLFSMSLADDEKLMIMAYHNVDPAWPIDKLKKILGTGEKETWALTAALGFRRDKETPLPAPNYKFLNQQAQLNPSFLVRAQAMLSLHKGKDDLHVLKKGLMEDPSPAVRACCALKLLQLKDTASIPFIVQALWFMVEPHNNNRTIHEGDWLWQYQSAFDGALNPFGDRPAALAPLNMPYLAWLVVKGLDAGGAGEWLIPFKSVYFLVDPVAFQQCGLDVLTASPAFRDILLQVIQDPRRPPGHRQAASRLLEWQDQ